MGDWDKERLERIEILEEVLALIEKLFGKYNTLRGREIKYEIEGKLKTLKKESLRKRILKPIIGVLFLILLLICSFNILNSFERCINNLDLSMAPQL